ncbi:hypothetical protein K443DRAFT_40016, partial [Laccaria amethystina LaAM-08-1]
MASNTILQDATGTTISGDAQVINAGRDVNIVHGPPAGLSQLLRPVSNATHTRSGPVAKCYPGTRVEVINTIRNWLGRRDKQSVCWLNGPAGYGKSGLSQTIAERYADQGRLLGSFFFLRGAGHRSHIARLISTFSHQISISVPATKRLIAQALEEDSTLLDSSISIVHQFRRLITNPLSSLSTRFSPSKILVIDGLDECDDKVQMAEFIEMLIDMSQRDQLPFRILLTSRVEEHIRKKFADARAQSVLYCIDLDAFDARPDIHLYFEQEFGRIYDQNLPIMWRIPQPWPSSQALSVLLDMAGSSFMFAATMVRLVGEDPMPYKVLRDVLASGSNGLDPLYKQVLSSASQTPTFYRLLASIMVLKTNQSINSLGLLLDIQAGDIVLELLKVQSIVKIPGDDNELMMLYHTSLRDFLSIKSRSGYYFIDPPSRHLHMALDCLKCLAKDSSEDFFDSSPEYAIVEWPHHIILVLQEQEPIWDEAIMNTLVYSIEKFLTFQGKKWFNTMMSITYMDDKDMQAWLGTGVELSQ